MKIWIILVLISLSSCTNYHAKVGNAEVDMWYFLQDKNIKSFTFNSKTGEITIENFGTQTSQVVEAAVSAALGGSSGL